MKLASSPWSFDVTSSSGNNFERGVNARSSGSERNYPPLLECRNSTDFQRVQRKLYFLLLLSRSTVPLCLLGGEGGEEGLLPREIESITDNSW